MGFLTKMLVRGAKASPRAAAAAFNALDEAALYGVKGGWKLGKGAYHLLRPSKANLMGAGTALTAATIAYPFASAAFNKPTPSLTNRLNEEYLRGLSGMPKISSDQTAENVKFTEPLSYYYPTEKIAGRAGTVPTVIFGTLGKNLTKEVGKAWEKLKNFYRTDPAKAILAGAGAGLGTLGLATAYELSDRPADTSSYLIGKKIFGLPSRVRADEVMAEEFFKTLGKETARRAVDVGASAIQQGAVGAQRAINSIRRAKVVNSLVNDDDIISRADPEVVSDAMNTFSRFAPTLSTDPNAVRSYLREAVTYGTGPDFATISNIANTESNVSQIGIPNFGAVQR